MWFAVRAVALAAACGIAGAVTSDTNTPTTDANYMVLQGDFEYAIGGANLGAIAGRAQMMRSALRSSTVISSAIKIQTAAAGTVFDVVLRRHACDVPSSTLYQDPYQCPGFDFGTDTNTCQPGDGIGDVTVERTCTVADGSCRMSYDWGIYIPEEYEGQRLVDMSVAMVLNGDEFACANLKISRDTTATEGSISADGAGATGQIVSGSLARDELGYSHVQFVAVGMTPGRGYSSYVGDGPCSDLFPKPQPVAGLSTTFVADGIGMNRDVAFNTVSIIGPEAVSLIVVDSLAGTDIMCYDLEILAVDSKSAGGVSRETGLVDSISACDSWADLYRGPAEKESWKKYKHHGKGKGKGKGKDGKYRAFGDFSDTTVTDAGTGEKSTRCCLSDPYVTTTSAKGERQAKMSALTWSFGGHGSARPASSSFYVGVGSGIAGVIVLAAGVIMHVRRTRHSIVAYAMIPEAVGATEVTPLNKDLAEATAIEDEGIDGAL